MVVHHIAGDGWSLGAAGPRRVGRVRRAAGGPVAGVGAAAGAVRRLRDLAAGTARRRGRSGQRGPRQVGYWRDALAGAPQQLALPSTGRARRWPATAGTPCALRCPGARLHARLRELAREHGVTLFMVVHAALAVLLARLGAGTDIAIGTPVAGRAMRRSTTWSACSSTRWCCAPTCRGIRTSRELLARVREADLAAFAHQDVPFERLVEVLNPARSQARHPLFQVMLTLQNNTAAVLELPGACEGIVRWRADGQVRPARDGGRASMPAAPQRACAGVVT